MKHIITSNDTSINIKYIDDEESYYQLNIPNNDINKKLIENTVFKFEKSGTQTIIMHDDVHVFQLSKMECKYSEFINMQNKLENTEKEVILLKQELSKNEKELVNFKNELLQQMKNEMVQLKNELFDTNNLLQKQIEKVNNINGS
jgi:ethanolamine utilization cobalamin adenosyltransferase